MGKCGYNCPWSVAVRGPFFFAIARCLWHCVSHQHFSAHNVDSCDGLCPWSKPLSLCLRNHTWCNRRAHHALISLVFHKTERGLF